MFNWDEEWNISFAGCGFRSVYYLGALSCILERVPQLVRGASRIGGASSGCLVAAALTVGVPIDHFCVDVLAVAREARKHTLGVFHLTFSLLRIVRETLLEKLPEDAHLRASGRLCVSLTRLADGENVLVSEFDSREELIQVLMCSCFFPVYSGFLPPTYRGVHYMDGALSNNMPLSEQRNTITVAPFSGESDICPRGRGTFNVEVHHGNVSIQVTAANVHRIWTSFLPPRVETLAEICHNGYMDALSFLRERDLLRTQCLPPSPAAAEDTVKPACCELPKEPTSAQESRKTPLKGQTSPLGEHWWLDRNVIENLPVNFKKVLCEACRDSHAAGGRWPHLTGFLPVKVVLYLLTFLTLPMELTLLLTKCVILLSCTVICRLLTLTSDLCRQTRSSGRQDLNSLSALDLRHNVIQSLTSTLTPNSKHVNLEENEKLDLFSVTSTCSSNLSTTNKLTLNHRIKQTQDQQK